MVSEPAMGHLFQVEIDALDIGLWTECSGLQATYEVTTYPEGGQNMFEHRMMGRLKYDNIKLKRPLDDQTELVAGWFTSVHVTSLVRATGSITVFNAASEKIATWSLIDVIPVRWSAPTFTASSTSAAYEELELAHHGFTYFG